MGAKPDTSFLERYLAYTADTESPTLFHRWVAYSAIGALLGRKFYFPHGHFEVYPNMYVMIMGNPGTRKSAAIKMMKRLLRNIGYEAIAANRTSKEKFLQDLHDGISESTLANVNPESADNSLDNFLDGELDALGKTTERTSGPSEAYIMADEFNVFIGRGNLDFIDMLGDLWDYDGVYHGRVKNSKSVLIRDPTINLLGGNTPSGFARAFPPEVLEQGFLSRMLLIYGKPTGRKITFPRRPEEIETQALSAWLADIWRHIVGPAKVEKDAAAALEDIYTHQAPLPDSRFEYYSTRRFTHLIKLTLILAASNRSTTITLDHVIEANTVLTFTEGLMPLALGEFGASNTSDTATKIMEALYTTTEPLTIQDLWKVVSTDLDKIADLASIMQNLERADKVQVAKGYKHGGFLPKKAAIVESTPSKFIDMSYITQREKENV